MHDYRTIKISNLLSYYYQKPCYKSMKGPVKILYNKPIRGGIFNFNKLVPDLDIETGTPDS